MEIVGGLFADDQTLSRALEALYDDGFEQFIAFGPEDLFREPAGDQVMEEKLDLDDQRHTAMGTVSGISVNPRPFVPGDPTAWPVEEDLLALGVGEDDAERFMRGLHQNQRLLLVQTKAGRSDEAQEILTEYGALEPADATA